MKKYIGDAVTYMLENIEKLVSIVLEQLVMLIKRTYLRELHRNV